MQNLVREQEVLYERGETFINTSLHTTLTNRVGGWVVEV